MLSQHLSAVSRLRLMEGAFAIQDFQTIALSRGRPNLQTHPYRLLSSCRRPRLHHRVAWVDYRDRNPRTFDSWGQSQW